MKNNQITGNEYTSSSFNDFVIALKNNIMRNINVADVVQIITKYSDNLYQVKSITNIDVSLYVIAVTNITFNEGDIAIALFTDYDFRTNLKQLQNNLPINSVGKQSLHTKSNGVLIGKVADNPSANNNNNNQETV